MIESDLIDRKKAVFIVENMGPDRLVSYIEDRLKGKIIVPPLSPRSDELPEYFLEKVYEKSQNNDFKARFRSAVAKLLANEQLEISNPDYLASLLIFCEQFIITEAVGPVAGMAVSEKLKGISSAEGDLHLRVLMALARMPQGLNMTDIWKNAVDDHRYTSAAFAALMAQGLEVITGYLPRFTQKYIENPGSIDLKIALLTLFEEFKEDYSEGKIIRLIVQSVENENQEIVDTIYNILESMGKKLPLPVKEVFSNSGQQKSLLKLKSSLFLLSTQKEDRMKEIAPAIIVAWKEFARLKNKRSRAEKWTRFENEYKERADHLNKEGISEEKGSRFTFHVPKNLRGND